VQEALKAFVAGSEERRRQVQALGLLK